MEKKINLLREFSIPLLTGVIIAVFWANISPSTYLQFIDSPLFLNLNLTYFVNDVFMVFFFGIATVEITQSLLPGGALNPFKKAVNPLLATLGGVIGPALAYILLNHFWGKPEYFRGWGITTATDIALAWLVARFIFGSKHPAVPFLLLLAIADDAIGLAIIAIFYPDINHPVASVWLLLVIAGMMVAFLLRKKRIKNYWPYILLGGMLSWAGLSKAHLHPALALVFIVPFMPAPKKAKEELFEDDIKDHSTLMQFEHDWKVFIDIGLFMFGLSNAGVEFTSVNSLTWIIFFAILIGKTFGIFIMGYMAMLMGFRLPDKMGLKELIVAGNVAAIGFTVALFIAGQAFSGTIQASAKMGALFSIFIAIIAYLISKALKVRRITGIK